MQRIVRSLSRTKLLTLLVALGTACAAGPASSPRSPSSANEEEEWVDRLHPAPLKLTVALRPRAYPDPGWWHDRDAHSLSDAAGVAFLRCAQADLYVFFAPVQMLVLHGVPPGMDPARLDPGGSGNWTYAGQAPQTEEIGAPPSTTPSYSAGDPTGSVQTLFVLPASTWVIFNERVPAWLAAKVAHAGAPPLLPLRSGSYFESYFSGNQHEQARGLAIDPPSPAGSLAVAYETFFSDAGAARAGAEPIRRKAVAVGSDRTLVFQGVAVEGSMVQTRYLALEARAAGECADDAVRRP